MAKRRPRKEHKNAQNNYNSLPKFVDTGKLKKNISIIPRNIAQENYLLNLTDQSKDIIFAIGPAGCGKTLLPTLFAIKLYQSGVVDKIVITRPNIAVDDRDIGYLPGDLFSKMAPWVIPIMDIFEEHFSIEQINDMIERKVIEVCPIAYIRGRTFKNSFILVDEAQNTTDNSMLSILTRLGENSKMVVTGDIQQSDRGKQNGLSGFLSRWHKESNYDRIAVCQFETRDVERHPVVEQVLQLYKAA